MSLLVKLLMTLNCGWPTRVAVFDPLHDLHALQTLSSPMCCISALYSASQSCLENMFYQYRVLRFNYVNSVSRNCRNTWRAQFASNRYPQEILVRTGHLGGFSSVTDPYYIVLK